MAPEVNVANGLAQTGRVQAYRRGDLRLLVDRRVDKARVSGYCRSVKHGQLRGVAHDVADSFVSGIGLPIGFYVTDVFGEAGKTSQG